jgi:hypothetical protein
MGPGGLATPETGGRLRGSGRPPNKPTARAASGGPGGRWGSVVFGWRALRPPRVVFVIGCVSCNQYNDRWVWAPPPSLSLLLSRVVSAVYL